MITLKLDEWVPIQQKIIDEYPLSTVLIRSKMKRELGFTVRNHRDYSSWDETIDDIRLDFYDDAKETMFRLKYL